MLLLELLLADFSGLDQAVPVVLKHRSLIALVLVVLDPSVVVENGVHVLDGVQLHLDFGLILTDAFEGLHHGLETVDVVDLVLETVVKHLGLLSQSV